MPPRVKRDKKYEFRLEVMFTDEGETNAFTFTALKDALNERDKKNTVKVLSAMNKKDDPKRFMMLVLYNDKLAGVNHQNFKSANFKGQLVLTAHKFECISCKHSHSVDSFARTKLGG